MFDWIESFADWLVYSILEISSNSSLGKALHFFVYDTIKILMLLFGIVFLMGIINSYFPIEKIKNFLSQKKWFGLQYLFASVFGAVTPFCSCSSVPLFIGFVKGGIPLGVTFSFLITSPLVNEVAVAMFLGLFGLKATLIYALSGILLGTFAGWVLGKMNLEVFLSDWVKSILEGNPLENEYSENTSLSFKERLPEIFNSASDIVGGIIIYVIIGIGLGAAMHGYIPEQFFAQYLGSDAWWTVPLAVLLAVPMYANAAGVVPVIQVLVAKGVPMGTAIAFMMATVGLSVPEATLLKKVMTFKLIVLFFGVVSLCMIALGYVFNVLL